MLTLTINWDAVGAIAGVVAVGLAIAAGLCYALGVLRPWRIAEAEYETLPRAATGETITNIRMVIRSRTRNDQTVEQLALIQYKRPIRRLRASWAEDKDIQPLNDDQVLVPAKQKKQIQRQISGGSLPYSDTALIVKGPRRRPLTRRVTRA